MKIALGTAQWGMEYGISNTKGIPSDQELSEIFNFASQANIDTFDTAGSYGNAEIRLGKFVNSAHKIISKFKAVSEENSIEIQLNRSLGNLNQSKLEGLLFHNAQEVLTNDSIWDEINVLKNHGLVNKIGFSLYNPIELEQLLEKKINPDIVQIPFNILDRRFEDYFSLLKSHGTEIHVRSVFLQGLLINSSKESPKDFEQWDSIWATYRAWLSSINRSPIEACIQHVMSYDLIDKIIVGVTNLNELQEIVEAQSQDLQRAPISLKSNDENLINPLEWQITKKILSNKS
jgi:aryl-alcohol dehydrogenase-like predicted oxidoreductase